MNRTKISRILIGFFIISLLTMTVFAEENLLKNGNFTSVDHLNMPNNWYTQAWFSQEDYTLYKVEPIENEEGNALSIWNLDDNDARYVQEVKVKPNATYKLSGYIKTENVEDNGWGANLSIGGIHDMPPGVYGSEKWTYIESYGTTGPKQSSIEVWLRLGGYSGESKGKAYFSQVSLVEVPSIPLGAVSGKWFVEEQKEVVNQNQINENKPWFTWSSILLFYIILLLVLYRFFERGKNNNSLDDVESNKKLINIIFVTGLLLSLFFRLIISAKIPGYGVDMNCFIVWGDEVNRFTPQGFYSNTSFCDYPPGYLYVLAFNSIVNKGIAALGEKISWINVYFTQLQHMIIRFVPNMADLLGAIIIFRYGKKRFTPLGALSLGLLYAFNPLTILNSAAWGQIDSVLALSILLVVLLALEKKWQWVLPVFVISILTKPQALMFGPLGLLAIVFSFIWEKNSLERKKGIKNLLIGFFLSLGVAALIILPFNGGRNLSWIIDLYKNTLSSYPYASVNAANFFYLLGGNWSDIGTNISHHGGKILMIFGSGIVFVNGLILYKKAKFSTDKNIQKEKKSFNKYVTPILLLLTGILYFVFGLLKVSFALVGNTSLIITILLAVWLFFQGKDLQNLPMVGAMMLIVIFSFAVKMHERYIYPALILLFLAYTIKKDRRILWVMLGITVTTFFNVGIILHNDILLNGQGGHLSPETHKINQVISFINVAISIYTLWITASITSNKEKGSLKEKKQYQLDDYKKDYQPNPRKHHMGFDKKDIIIVLITTVFFALLTFSNLGSTVSPQTQWKSVTSGEYIVIDTHSENPYQLLFYSGVNRKDFFVSTSNDGEIWDNYYRIALGKDDDYRDCYKWKYAYTDVAETENRFTGRYIKISVDSVGLNLWELIFRDFTGKVLPVTIEEHYVPENQSISANASALLDEQDTFFGEPGWYNSTYFDEIYHARTAYEHLHGIQPYETSHPPLGKIFISWGIALFGMTPFGWRFAGALVGVLMVPAMYLLAKQLTKKRSLAIAAMLLMTFDLMHFAQTRIATIDSFPVLFIMLAYWAMFRYMQTDIYSVGWKERLLPLLLSGFFIGLSIASKWIGAYGAFGLAVLFFWTSLRNISIGLNIEKSSLQKDFSSNELSNNKKINKEKEIDPVKIFLITCLWCVLFFVIIPILIYTLSYIPYFAPSGGVTLEKLINAQKSMLSYHGKPGLGMDHPFYSPWWQWPIIGKPMWYSSSTVTNGMGSTIVALGNPVVWWAGLVAVLITIVMFIKQHLWMDEKKQLIHIGTRKDDPSIAMVLIALASQYVPWVLVPRGTYIYHYFASVPFIILCTILVIKWITEKHRKVGNILLWSLVGLSFIAFVILFPYASGLNVPVAWLELGKKIFSFPLYY